ncbi:uncharacterized protein LOC136771750 isoform X2 [Amia ocellicauda]|uniref:uncharacterized protein LOC136771750 isoform X2 n=1 Tax=Amia ocellicauda TaxID=2972642 RepID=UPI003464BF68
MLRKVSLILQRHAAPIFHNTSRKQSHLHANSLFKVHPSVSEALENQKPVVALESTIITHGMPYPHNLSTAKEVEAIVKTNGATPATVAVLEGRVHVGLSEQELQFLASTSTSLKVSRRDLPYVLSKSLSGGTTVSATMIAAHRAGIPVFVTGGVGGVHRGGQTTMDVSADLTELGRTPITVVSAGVKSILDIGRTLEYLETQGVCVATFGKTKDFPAFFSPHSGFTSPYNVANAEEAAELIITALSLGLESGLLIAVPISEEQAAIGQHIEDAIQTALSEVREKGITGRNVTPFILQRINALTRGKSLEANISLIYNNAKVGSQIACALTKLKQGKKTTSPSQPKRSDLKSHPRTIVIGGINVDFIAKGKQERLLFGQTNPGSVYQSFGGVGRNIADCLTRLGEHPLFISAIGNDTHADSVLSYCRHMNTTAVARIPEQRTATYCAVITEEGELSLGLGDMDIHQQVTKQYVSQFEQQLSSASLVCLDGNIPVSTIDYVCSIARKHAVPVWYEPTDPDKACNPFLSDSWKSLTYISPNLAELLAMNRTLGFNTPAEPTLLEDVLNTAMTLCHPLLEHLLCVVVTLGPHGVLLFGKSESGTVYLQSRNHHLGARLCAIHYPALPVSSEEIVNVSGAGDSLAAGIMAGILQERDTDTCVRMGLIAARLSLGSHDPVAPSLSMETINPERMRSHCCPQGTVHWSCESNTSENIQLL